MALINSELFWFFRFLH